MHEEQTGDVEFLYEKHPQIEPYSLVYNVYEVEDGRLMIVGDKGIIEGQQQYADEGYERCELAQEAGTQPAPYALYQVVRGMKHAQLTPSRHRW